MQCAIIIFKTCREDRSFGFKYLRISMKKRGPWGPRHEYILLMAGDLSAKHIVIRNQPSAEPHQIDLIQS